MNCNNNEGKMGSEQFGLHFLFPTLFIDRLGQWLSCDCATICPLKFLGWFKLLQTISSALGNSIRKYTYNAFKRYGAKCQDGSRVMGITNNAVWVLRFCIELSIERFNGQLIHFGTISDPRILDVAAKNLPNTSVYSSQSMETSELLIEPIAA